MDGVSTKTVVERNNYEAVESGCIDCMDPLIGVGSIDTKHGTNFDTKLEKARSKFESNIFAFTIRLEFKFRSILIFANTLSVTKVRSVWKHFEIT